MSRSLALITLCLVLAGCGASVASQGTDLHGIVRTPTPVVRVEVPRGGRLVPLLPEPGHLLAVYFGYTSCPDVCPTTLADLATARRALGDLGGRVELAMITVDPERDRLDVLAPFVRHFVPDASAVVPTSTDDLQRLEQPFGATSQVRAGAAGVEVDHTSQLYLLDDGGHLRVSWPFGTTADELARDLRGLLGASAAP